MRLNILWLVWILNPAQVFSMSIIPYEDFTPVLCRRMHLNYNRDQPFFADYRLLKQETRGLRTHYST